MTAWTLSHVHSTGGADPAAGSGGTAVGPNAGCGNGDHAAPAAGVAHARRVTGHACLHCMRCNCHPEAYSPKDLVCTAGPDPCDHPLRGYPSTAQDDTLGKFDGTV